MDLQVVLVLILSLLTLNLLIVGFYVILVLREFRQTVKKANVVLDRVTTIAHVASSPVASVIGAVIGVLDGVKTVRSLVDGSKDKED